MRVAASSRLSTDGYVLCVMNVLCAMCPCRKNIEPRNEKVKLEEETVCRVCGPVRYLLVFNYFACL